MTLKMNINVALTELLQIYLTQGGRHKGATTRRAGAMPPLQG